MKKLNYIVLLLLAATTLTSSAQDEIKKRPIKKQDMGVKELMIDGIKVIYKPSTKDIVMYFLNPVLKSILMINFTLCWKVWEQLFLQEVALMQVLFL